MDMVEILASKCGVDLPPTMKDMLYRVEALEYFFKCFNDLTLKSTDHFIEHLERLEHTANGEMFAEYKQEIIKLWEEQNAPHKWEQ